MDHLFNQFCNEIKQVCEHKDRNIIIYGGGRGGDFVRWYIERKTDTRIKAWIDRWSISDRVTIPHMWALSYIHEKGDIIINCSSKDIESEYNDTGERFERTLYSQKDIVELWRMMYGSGVYNRVEEYPEITYYDWLEWKYKVDLLRVIRRKDTDGDFAHGYAPTDTRVFIDTFESFHIGNDDAILDIGAGKGTGAISLSAVGFKNIGAIEYTNSIYKTLCNNMKLLGLDNIKCYNGDAAELTTELDRYNWFFLFNPFNWETMEKVLNRIEESVTRRSRIIRIVYAEPICHNLIMKTGKYKLIYINKDDYSDVSYYTYVYERV